MPSRLILEITCNQCGKIDRFEMSSTEGKVCSLNPMEHAFASGWVNSPALTGSHIFPANICPVCQQRNGMPKQKFQKFPPLPTADPWFGMV